MALKLGPSRSASTANRSASTPITNQKTSTRTPPPLPNSPSAPVSINKPTVNPTPPQPPRRPSTFASSARSVSQPVTQTQQPQKDGVWADLISLNEPPRTSSLPLQYQVPVTPTGVGLGVNMTNNTFAPPLQMVRPMTTPSYQSPFSQTVQSPGYTTFTPLQTGYTNVAHPLTPQLQQQFLQPQPTSAGLPLSVPQPMMQHAQFTTSSPAILSTPSPAGSFVNHSPQLPVPSPGYMHSQTTLTVSQPSVMMTGAPQMQMSMPMQTGMTSSFTPPVQVQSLGYTPGLYQAQTGFGHTGHHQWGPL